MSKEEIEELKNIGNKDYLLDANEKRKVLFSLVDIIYAYAYNHRTTLGETTVESAWTVNKLSSTLSWLEVCFNDDYFFLLSILHPSLQLLLDD